MLRHFRCKIGVMDSEDPKTSLLGAFDESLEPEAGDTHPHEKKILKEICAILERSPTGNHLIQLSGAYNIRLRISPGAKESQYFPEKRTIVLTVSKNQNKATARQVLELAGCLRDAEQGILGYDKEEKTMDSQEVSALNHARNLDIIADLCRISEELKSEAPELKNELFAMGYEEIFEAFHNKADQNQLAEIYIKTVQKTEQ